MYVYVSCCLNSVLNLSVTAVIHTAQRLETRSRNTQWS